MRKWISMILIVVLILGSFPAYALEIPTENVSYFGYDAPGGATALGISDKDAILLAKSMTREYINLRSSDPDRPALSAMEYIRDYVIPEDLSQLMRDNGITAAILEDVYNDLLDASTSGSFDDVVMAIAGVLDDVPNLEANIQENYIPDEKIDHISIDNPTAIATYTHYLAKMLQEETIIEYDTDLEEFTIVFADNLSNTSQVEGPDYMNGVEDPIESNLSFDLDDYLKAMLDEDTIGSVDFDGYKDEMQENLQVELDAYLEEHPERKEDLLEILEAFGMVDEVQSGQLPLPSMSVSQDANDKVDLDMDGVAGATLLYSFDGSTWLDYDDYEAFAQNVVIYGKQTKGNAESDVTYVVVDWYDESAPVLQLLGGQSVTIGLSDDFESMDTVANGYGYNVYDDIDDNVEVTIDYEAIETEVGENKIGTYAVEYLAEDDAGNFTTAFRYVTVADQDEPTITIDNMAIDNGDRIEVYGSDLLVDFTVEDNSVAIADCVVTVDGILVGQYGYGTNSITIPLDENGHYSKNNVRIQASDDAGNITTFDFTVDTQGVQVVKNYIGFDYTPIRTNQDVEVTFDQFGINNAQLNLFLVYSIHVDYVDDAYADFDALNTNSVIVEHNAEITFDVIILGHTTQVTFYAYVNNIDKDAPTAPVLNMEAGTVLPNNYGVFVEMTEPDESHVVHYYKIDGGSWVEYSGKFLVEEDATVYAKAVDLATNESYDQLDIIGIDKDKPEMDSKVLTVNDLGMAPSSDVVVNAQDIVGVTVRSDAEKAYVKLGYNAAVEVDYEEDLGGRYFEYTIPQPALSTSYDDITVWVVDDAGNKSDVESVVGSLTMDVVAPVITLIGGTPFDSEYGIAYSDKGFMYVDDQDGTGTYYTYNGFVDISSLGPNTLTYQKADAAGNMSNEETRTVEIVDTLAPVITLFEPLATESYVPMYSFSANAYNHPVSTETLPIDVAVNGTVQASGVAPVFDIVLDPGVNTITLTAEDASGNVTEESFTVTFIMLASDEPEFAPSTVEPTNTTVFVKAFGQLGSTVMVYKGSASDTVATVDKNDFVEFYSHPGVTNDGIAFSENGKLFAYAIDSSFNSDSAIVEYEVTNIDTEAPVINSVTWTPENVTSSDVTVTIDATDTVTYVTSVSNMIYDYDGPFTISENMSIGVIATDLAGNSDELTVHIENIDKTAPVATVVYSNTGITSQPVLATITADEPFVMLYGERSRLFTENDTVTYVISDMAGNMTDVEIVVENIDTTPLVVINDVAFGGINGTNKVKEGSVVEVVVEVDGEGEGYFNFGTLLVNQPMQYVYDADTDQHFIKGAITVPGDYSGPATVKYVLRDPVGNMTTNSDLRVFTVDNRAPVVEIVPGSATVFGDNQFIVSDVVELEVTTETGAILEEAIGLSESWSVINSGTQTYDPQADTLEGLYRYRAVDDIGNISDIYEYAFKKDTQAPDGPTPDGSLESLVTVPYYLISGTASGETVRIEKDGSFLAEVSSEEFASGLDIVLSEGDNTFTFTTKDLAGNESPDKMFAVTLDSISPDLWLEGPSEGPYDIGYDEPVVESRFSVNGSEYVDFDIDATLTKEMIDAENIHPESDTIILRISAKDAAGNESILTKTRAAFAANELIQDQQMSDDAVVKSGSFDADTEMSMEGAETPDGMEGDAYDFNATNGAEIVEPIVTDFFLGLGYPAFIKVSYVDEDTGETYVLDQDPDHGHSMYNPGPGNIVTTYEGVDYTVEPGHLLVIMKHFSLYVIVWDTTAPELTVSLDEDTQYLPVDDLSFDVELNENGRIEVYVNDTIKEEIDADEEVAVTVDLNLSNGSNAIKVLAYDDYNNPSESVYRTVVVDPNAPDVTVELDGVETYNYERKTKNDIIDLAVAVADDYPDNLKITIKGESTTTDNLLDDDVLSYQSAVELVYGMNYLTILAEDKAGKETEHAYEIQMDNVAPTIEIEGVIEGDILKTGAEVTVTTDDELNGTNVGIEFIDLATGQVMVVGQSLVSQSTLTGNQNEVTKSVPSITNGRVDYKLQVTAWDEVGNYSIEVLYFSIDTRIPVLTINGIPEDTILNEDVALSYLVNPTDSVVAINALNGDEEVEWPSGYDMQNFSDEGEYFFTFTANNNGFNAVESVEFEIDKTDPEVSIVSSKDGDNGARKITYSATDKNLDGVYAFYIVGEHSDDPDDYTAFDGTLLINKNGTYAVRVMAFDKAGNMTVAQETYTVTINSGNDNGNSSGGSSSGGNAGGNGNGNAFGTITIEEEEVALGVAGVPYIDGTEPFRPEDKITRAELSVWLTTVMGYTTERTASIFPDVSALDPEFEAIHALYDQDLIGGFPDGTFRPDAQLTRAQFTKMMHQIIIKDKIMFNINGVKAFNDDGLTKHWAALYIWRMTAEGLFGGYPDGFFYPERSLTRAQAVKVINVYGQRELQTELYIDPTFTDVPADHWAYDQIEAAVRGYINTTVTVAE